MRVIEADDVQPAAARISPAVEVILWIDQKPRRRLVRDIPRPEGLEDRRIAAEQQPAAFGWNGFPRVGDDRLERHASDPHSYFQIQDRKSVV